MTILEKEPFLQAIRAIKGVTSKMNMQPILKTIRITNTNGGLCLTATDLDNSAKTSIEAQDNENIDICLNVDKLENIVNALSGLITMRVKDNYVILKDNNTKFKLFWLDAKDFPHIDFKISDNFFCIPANIFINSINKAIIATQNDSYNVLSGVCFTLKENMFEMVSTDGNRLLKVSNDYPVKQNAQYVVPKKNLLDIAKVAKDNVKIYFVEMGINKRIVFETNGYMFMSNLIDATFPKYELIIPTVFEKQVKIQKKELIAALEKVSIMSNDLSNIIVFNFNNDTLELSAENDNGDAKTTIAIQSYNFDEPLKMGFNCKYILDGLKICESDEIVFNLNGELRPCLIDDSNFIYLIMPIQLKK